MERRRTSSGTALGMPAGKGHICAALVPFLVSLLHAPAYANPDSGKVVAGGAAIAGEGTARVTVTQTTPRAIINWNSFSIGAGERTDFVQPSSASIALNRVTGVEPSEIFGTLTANGRLVLVNRNGVLFGKGATIDAGGLLATTHDVDDEAFMSGGPLRFGRSGDATASVVNEGRITIRDAGMAAFVAPHVRNAGVIQADLGTVALASARGFTLDLYGDRLISFEVGDELVETLETADGTPLKALVENPGAIEAAGGRVYLTAQAAREVVNQSINLSGIVRADSVAAQDGVIVLSGSGDVAVEKEAVVSASGAVGGGIEVAAGGLLTTEGEIRASGGSGAGGTVRIGGAAVSQGADIVATGSSGGTVSINAGWLSQGGSIEARGTDGAGGNVALEVSGAVTAASGVAIDASGRSAGGAIRMVAGQEVLTSAAYRARGEEGVGGTIDLTGRGVRALSATFDASGASGGGRIRLGGEARGGKGLALDELPNAEILWLNDGTEVRAGAFGPTGDGGQVVLWSERSTVLLAEVDARPGLSSGAGGHVEVSSAGEVTLTDRIASGRGGRHGTLLLDPKNIVIGDVESASYQFQMLLGFDYLNNSETVGALQGSDHSGTAVALDGNRLVVGAHLDDGATNGFANSGAARLFLFDNDHFANGRLVGTIGRGYTGGRNIDLPALNPNDRLGISASLDGTRLAVGAHLDDASGVGNNDNNFGAAYLFTFADEAFTGGQHVGTIGRNYTGGRNVNVGLQAQDQFGVSLSLDGNRLAVGAHTDDASGVGSNSNNFGAVYLFTFDDEAFNGGALAGIIGRNYTGGKNFNVATLDANDRFGISVSLDGNRLAVGAQLDDASGAGSNNNNFGAAYLFTFSDSTFSDAQLAATIGRGYTGAKDVNLTLGASDSFGRSVSLDGDRLAVGAAGDDGDGAALTDSGAVHLFTFADSVFNGGQHVGTIGSGYTTNTRDIDLTKLDASDSFGVAVSLDGTRLAVGAHLDDGSGNTTGDSGAAYLFNFDDLLFNGGRHTATIGKGYGAAPGLDVTRLQASDFFGVSVSLDGSRLAVGAYGDDAAANNVSQSGAVYLFTFEDESFNGALLEGIIGRGYTGGKHVNVPTLQVNDNFGLAVSLDGNRLVVGGNSDDGNGVGSNTNNFGAAYLFTFADEFFTGGQHVGTIGRNYTGGRNVNVGLQAQDQFGVSVALDGNRLAVGAHLDDASGVGSNSNNFGAVYLFTFDDAAFSGGTLAGIVGKNYTGGRNINVAPLNGNDRFGIGVSLDGNRMAVGAHLDDASGVGSNNNNFGAVYLFTFDDAAFNGGEHVGTIGRNYTSGPRDFNMAGLQGADHFGVSVSLDGNRLAVGAHADDGFGDTLTSAGAVYLFTFADSVFNGAVLESTLGAGYTGGKNFNVGALGGSDVFGRTVSLDGNRLAVGSHGNDGNGNVASGSGAAYLFTFGDDAFTGAELASVFGKGYGGVNGFDVPGLQAGDAFGYGLSLDGNRLAVGARLDDGAGNLVANSGAVHLFTFSDSLFSGAALAGTIGRGYIGGNNIDMPELAVSDQFGVSVSLDGARLAVGARLDDGPGAASNNNNFGSVHLFTFADEEFNGGQQVGAIGRGYTTAADPQNIDVPSLAANDQFGFSTSLDGTRLAVGAWVDDGASGPADSGAVYLFTFNDLAFNGGEHAGTIGAGHTTALDPENVPVTLGAADRFGSGASLDGTRLAVGAYLDDGASGAPANSGAVYLFTFDDLNFANGQLAGIIGNGYTTATDPENVPMPTLEASDQFGISVSLDGRRLAVGAFGDDGFNNILTNSGAVYIFTFSDEAFGDGRLDATVGKGYTGGNNIDINSLGESDFFGIDVSIDASRMAVGASGDDGNNNPAADAGAAYLFVAGPGVNSYLYGDDPASDVTVSAEAVRNLLATQDLIFQANNDITVAAPIEVDSPTDLGGTLTLQAGRSVLIDADIALDNGSLVVIANDDVENEVVDAHRDPGPAVITMAPGVSIDAGTGLVEMYLRAGEGKTNFDSGAITLGSIAAGTITVVNEGASAGSDIVIQPGAVLAASGADDAIVLAAASGGTFTNNAGAGALSASGGRWLIYSGDPALTTLGGLTHTFKRYNRTYEANPPGMLTETGNGVLYGIAPVLTIAADDASRVYGDANPAFTYTAMGFIDGDTAATPDALSGLPSLATSATESSPVGSYGINAALGSLLSEMGYQFSFVDGTLTVTPRPITLSANSISKAYGDADPMLSVSIASGSLGAVDTLDEVTGTLTREAGEIVGSYDVFLGAGAKASNYTIAYTVDNDAFAITPRAISLAADLASKTYGDADPALTVSIASGSLAGGDTLADVAGTLTREAGEDVGNYDVFLGAGAKASNYTIAYTVDNDAFAITPRAISLAADLASKTYGEVDPALTVSITSGTLAGGDTLADVAGALARETGEDVGSYDVFLGTGAKAGNYAISYAANNDAFSITARAIGLAAELVSKTYGDADPAPTVSITSGSLASGDTLADVAGALTREAGEDVGSYDVFLGTGARAGNYAITYAADNDAFSITARAISLAADLVSKTYGDADPALTVSVASGSLAGGDTLADVAGTLARETGEDVGSYDVFLGTGTKAGNYAITYAANNDAFSITARAIGLAAELVSKTYGDADPALTVSVASGSLAGGDTLVDVTGAVSRQPGETVGAYDVLLGGGAKASNYAIAYTIDNDAFTITPASLAASLTGTVSKVYDATTAATLTAAEYTLSGILAGDDVELDNATVGTYDTKNVGTGKTVTVNGLALTGPDAGNYRLVSTATSGAVGEITAAILTLSGVTADNKVYDGTTAATLTTTGHSLNGVRTGDTVTLDAAGYSAFFDDKNAGTGKAVAVSGLGLGGTDAGNYTLSQLTGLAADIAKAALTVVANKDTKIVTQSDTAGYNGASYSGFVQGETVADISGTLSVTRSNVGTEAAGTYTGVLVPSGHTSDNYNITYVNGDYQILPARQLLVRVQNVSNTYGTVPGYAVASVQYLDGDGTTIHTLTQTAQSGSTYTYSDGVGGSVTFTVAPSGAIISNAGYLAAGNYALSGTDVSIVGNNFLGLNYVGNQTVGQLGLVPIASGITKVYDGTTAITGLTLDLTGVLASDLVRASGSGGFVSKNAGSDLAYTINNVTLSGADATNYFLTTGSGFSGSGGVITPRPITVSGTSANNRAYDGTTVATLTTMGHNLDGVVAGDAVALDGRTYSALFSDRNVGTAKAVTVSGLGLSGTDAGNYTLSQPTGLTADITAAPLEIAVDGTVAASKMYDGTTASAVTSGGMLGGTVFGTDQVALDLSGTSYADRNVGIGKAVNGTYSLVGADAGNYQLVRTDFAGTADITAATLTARADDKRRRQGDANPPFTYTLTGLESTDDESVVSGLVIGTPATRNSPAGTYAIQVSGGTALNYVIDYVDGVLTVEPHEAAAEIDELSVRRLVVLNERELTSADSSPVVETRDSIEVGLTGEGLVLAPVVDTAGREDRGGIQGIGAVAPCSTGPASAVPMIVNVGDAGAVHCAGAAQ